MTGEWTEQCPSIYRFFVWKISCHGRAHEKRPKDTEELWIPSEEQIEQAKAGLKSCFWALIGTNRDESAFWSRRAGRRVSVSKSGLSRRDRDGWQVWVRERERYRERERKRDRLKWRHLYRAKLAMSLHFPMLKIRTIAEFTLSLAKYSHFSLSLHTSCLSSFLKWSPLWRWNSQSVHTFRCQKNSPSLFGLSLEWRGPRDEWSKTQDKWSNSAQSYCSSHRKNESH